MKRASLRLAVGLALGCGASCGFGFADDSGHPIPATSYWGWLCDDGSLPQPDAACPPPSPCADLSRPALNDGGACACEDGTLAPDSACEPDGGLARADAGDGG